MALTACATCGHEVSTTARACPKCGAPPTKSVYCTRCGGSMLDAESVCRSCGADRYGSPSIEKHGNPSTANAPTPFAPPSSTDPISKGTVTAVPKWQCPKCNSENVQSLSVI